jgi:release factor glutamine methyltransferase
VTTWRDVRIDTEAALRARGVDTPEAEARFLVERVSDYEGADLILGEDEAATDAAIAHVHDMVERRAEGEPLQYVLGRWQFLDLDLLVDRRVLVPRPETEVVAQAALEEAVRLGARRGRHDPWGGGGGDIAVADLGTGSGALALTLATELADALVYASDVSDDALAVARANLAGVGAAATRVRLLRGSWFAALPDELRGALRLIVSNPPYVAEHEVPDLPAEVRDWEPHRALVSGPTGLEAIAEILAEAPAWLHAGGGAVVMELAPHQAERARTLAGRAGFTEVVVRPDLAGRDRVLVARRHATGGSRAGG